jgi:hypothetical protein
VRHVDILLYVLSEYVFYGKIATGYRLLRAVADALIPDIISSVRSRRCPYCGRVFKGRKYLRRHLETASNSTSCKMAFRGDKELVVGEYLRLRGRVVKLSRRECYKLRGLEQPTFRSLSELCEWVKANGLPQPTR